MYRSTARRWVGAGLTALLVAAALGTFATRARAEEVIFLQDGRTIRADKTTVIGDRLRIEKPSEIIEIPRSDVLTIHEVSRPAASPPSPPPTEVYRDVTQQMNEKVRQETQQILAPPRVHRP